MRYEKGHKQTTRDHIIKNASEQFRENGLAAVGIAGIMSAAGLTNGAFYTHFKSKDDLVRAVLVDALDQREQRLRGKLMNNAGPEESIRDYLAAKHRDNAGSGCPTAALVAEIARHPAKTREIFTKKIAEIIPLIAAHLRKGSAAERQRKATAIYSLMIGTLQLARAVTDRKLSDEILENSVNAVLTLAGEH